MIASKDVRFIKNNLLSNLAIVDVYEISVTPTNIDEFVDKTVALQTQSLVMRRLDTNNFLFSFSFIFLILLYFTFILFFGKTIKKACNKEIT